jgi:hypothetical protein
MAQPSSQIFSGLRRIYRVFAFGTELIDQRYIVMSRAFIVLVVFVLSACAGPRLPSPNSAIAEYDAHSAAVHVLVSGLQPASGVALIGPDGSRHPAAAMSVISGPHVLYNPPPSIGLGIGGFGFTGCCSAIGSGIGFGVPIGGPTVAEASDQFVTSALITVPTDYQQHWPQYRLEVTAGNQAMGVAAPAPSG